MEESPNQLALETDLLAQLIADKLRILEQIRELSRRQPAVIGEGDMSRLMNVLAGKERLLAELQNLEQRLDPFRDQDPDARVWRSQSEREHCRQNAERCETLLREIMLIEKQCEQELIARRNTTAQRIHAANDASHARAAYGQNAPQRSRLDLSSET